MKTSMKTLAIAALLATASAAQAQSSVTIYGSIDQYLNYMKSSSGAKIKSLEDGDWLRSRLGVRGQEDLGNGMFAKFQMEHGFSADNGTQADTTRFWDRQTWVGLGLKDVGEVRIGRQNGPIQARGAFVDYTWRDLGSIINNIGVPSRYDNDFSLITARTHGVQFEAHVALPEAPQGNRAIVYQASLDYVNDFMAVGYFGMHARPVANAPINKEVVYDCFFADWKYGQGTVYLAFVRTNNSTANATSNNAGTLVSNVGGYNLGNNADLNNFYNAWQISADYKLTPQLRVGALWGKIDDKSGRQRGADGGSIGGYYDLSKRTMLLAVWETMSNEANGGWRPSGSAGLKTNFVGSDVNGKRISGLQLGIVHRF